MSAPNRILRTGHTYDSRGISLVLQVRTAEHGQRTAETVAGDEQRVARVGLLGGVNLRLQRRSDSLVVVPEASVALAARA